MRTITVTGQSNYQIGSDFEVKARDFFRRTEGWNLRPDFAIDISISDRAHPHKFDLGSMDPFVLIECKRHTYTKPKGNWPSAKISVWNEAMLFFIAAPEQARKILFTLKDLHRKKSLAQSYVDRYGHLIPSDVEIWEFDESDDSGYRVHPRSG